MLKIFKSLGIIVAIIGIASVATYSYYTSVATSTGNTFSTGTLKLELSNDGSSYASSGVVIGTASGLKPGQVAGNYKLYFKNAGSIDGNIKAVMSYTGSDVLAKKMVISKADVVLAPDMKLLDRQAYWAKELVGKAGSEATAISNGDIVRIDAGTITVGSATLENLAPTIFGMTKLILYFNHEPTGELTFKPEMSLYEDMTLMLDKSAENDTQNTAIDIAVTATMKQLEATW